MDKLDWRFDKDHIVLTGCLYVVAAVVLVIATGYLFHVGWSLFEP